MDFTLSTIVWYAHSAGAAVSRAWPSDPDTSSPLLELVLEHARSGSLTRPMREDGRMNPL